MVGVVVFDNSDEVMAKNQCNVRSWTPTDWLYRLVDRNLIQCLFAHAKPLSCHTYKSEKAATYSFSHVLNQNSDQ